MSTGLLLSGGMDSIAIAWWKRPQLAFTIDYGQLSAVGEIRAAQTVSNVLGISHEVIRVDCRALGSGDMAGDPPAAIAPVSEWWPFRNQLIVTLAAMRAVALGVNTLLVGTVSTDGQHRDGTEEFYMKLDDLLSYQEGKMRVQAPAALMTTAELIRQSETPRSILGWAHSCHKSDYACGSCRGCGKHYSVTQELWGEGY